MKYLNMHNFYVNSKFSLKSRQISCMLQKTCKYMYLYMLKNIQYFILQKVMFLRNVIHIKIYDDQINIYKQMISYLGNVVLMKHLNARKERKQNLTELNILNKSEK